MRLLFTLLASIALLSVRAQTLINPALQFTPLPDYTPISKWQVRPYAAFSAGYYGASYLSTPVGVALYRPLNKNFTAYTAATVAPTLYNFGAGPLAKPFGFNNNMGWNAGISGGLIWTNDAKTFSISGGISVERGSYPAYAPAARPAVRKY